jgi:hypothetical protein
VLRSDETEDRHRDEVCLLVFDSPCRAKRDGHIVNTTVSAMAPL